MIKAEVRFTKKHFKATMFNCRFYNILCMIFCVCLAVIAICIGILVLLGSPLKPICFIPVVLGILYFVYLYVIFPAHSFENFSKRYSDALVYVNIDEDKLSFNMNSNGYNETVNISYGRILYAIETDEYFLFYPTRVSAYIIDKQGITEGSPAQLRTLLTEKLGGKFSVKD